MSRTRTTGKAVACKRPANDAELLSLCAAAVGLGVIYNDLSRTAADTVDGSPENKAASRACRNFEAAEKRAFAIPAVTIEGVQAKARITLTVWGNSIEGAAQDSAAITAILSDLMALGDDEPDPVFAAIEEHKAADAVFKAACESQPSNTAECDRLNGIEGRALGDLVAMTPRTVAGAAALLRHANAVLRDDEQPTPFDGYRHAGEPGKTLLDRVADALDGKGGDA